MGITVISWFEVDVGQHHLMVRGERGSASSHGLRRRWVTVPWLRWGGWGSQSARGLKWTWVSVTSWSEVVIGSVVSPTWRRRGDLGLTPTLGEERPKERRDCHKMSLGG